jgi:hypothetical protein
MVGHVGNRRKLQLRDVREALGLRHAERGASARGGEVVKRASSSALALTLTLALFSAGLFGVRAAVVHSMNPTVKWATCGGEWCQARRLKEIGGPDGGRFSDLFEKSGVMVIWTYQDGAPYVLEHKFVPDLLYALNQQMKVKEVQPAEIYISWVASAVDVQEPWGVP